MYHDNDKKKIYTYIIYIHVYMNVFEGFVIKSYLGDINTSDLYKETWTKFFGSDQ